jgi:hypothetical protein
MDAPKRPHWAWPHVVGLLVALIAYFAIYSVTGDSDLFIAIATGAAGAGLTWVWVSALHFARVRAHKASSQDQKSNP